MGEGAAIYNCILCDSYALITLGVLPDRKLARGIKGKAAYEDLLESFQESHASPARCHLLACPTCNAYARQDDAAHSAKSSYRIRWNRAGSHARVSPSSPRVSSSRSRRASSPHIRRRRRPGAKPKWRLVQGVGPPGLEVDRTRTGRLHKPSCVRLGWMFDRSSSRRRSRAGPRSPTPCARRAPSRKPTSARKAPMGVPVGVPMGLPMGPRRCGRGGR